MRKRKIVGLIYDDIKLETSDCNKPLECNITIGDMLYGMPDAPIQIKIFKGVDSFLFNGVKDKDLS